METNFKQIYYAPAQPLQTYLSDYVGVQNGLQNTHIGQESMHFVNQGQFNTAVGAFSLKNNIFGNNNVALGANTLYSLTGGSNNIAIGKDASLTGDFNNTIVLNASGNILNPIENQEGLYVNPIRNDENLSSLKSLYFNTNSYEITYGSTANASGIFYQNFLTVSKNGSDSNTGNGPFLTIGYALTKATSGYTVFIYPGTYNEKNLIIPDGVAVRGANVQTVIIQPSIVNDGDFGFQMGNSLGNVRLEDLTINMTSSSNISFYGVVFSLQNSTINSKMRTLVVNVTSTGTDISKSVFGVYVKNSASSSTSSSSSNAIRATTINTTSSNAKCRGIYIDSICNFTCRDTNVFASGTSLDVIGVEATTNASTAFIQLKTSSISGISSNISPTNSYDIKQPTLSSTAPSCIQLSSTDLINANADANGFTVNTAPAQQIYTVFNSTLGVSKTFYLFPGTAIYNQANEDISGTAFTQKCIVFGGILSLQSKNTFSNSATINLYKTTDPTTLGIPFTSVSATGNGGKYVSSRFANKCTTFTSSDYLQTQLVISSTGSNISNVNICLTLELY